MNNNKVRTFTNDRHPINNNINWWNFLEEDETSSDISGDDMKGKKISLQNKQDDKKISNKPLDTSERLSSKQDDDDANPSYSDVDEDENRKDFETWRGDFLKLVEKNKLEDMIESLRMWIGDTELEPPQSKFIYDNYQICIYRQNPEILKVSKETRSQIIENLDKTYPATTIVQKMTDVFERYDLMKQILIKLSAAYGLKGELHRKFIAAVLGAVQFGGGNKRYDLIYVDKNITINISTRFATEFGQISLGKWALKTNAAEDILSDSELDRLFDGAPEEKQVLRRRIILESMAKEYKNRSFIIHVNNPNGGTDSIGLDLGESLLTAYTDGRIIVRGNKSDNRSAVITDGGDIISLIDTDILFLKDTGEVDEYGNPQMVEVPFISVKDCNMMLVADKETLDRASSVINGIYMKEIPFTGNPSDIKAIKATLPDLTSILNKAY